MSRVGCATMAESGAISFSSLFAIFTSVKFGVLAAFDNLYGISVHEFKRDGPCRTAPWDYDIATS